MSQLSVVVGVLANVLLTTLLDVIVYSECEQIYNNIRYKKNNGIPSFLIEHSACSLYSHVLVWYYVSTS